jgi:two-component system nitrate/nitrite response regulator NarL
MEIVLCDDHRLLAELLGSVLSESGHAVALVASPAEAAAEVADRGVDVCVMDLGFPAADVTPDELSALEAIEEMSGRGCRVIVLSGSTDEVRRGQALAAGASDYLSKDEPITNLVEAVEHPEHGDRRRRCATRLRGNGSSSAPWTHASLADFLTPRERSVLEGLVQGENTTLLAERLGVRPATARTHVQNLLGKLCVHSRLEAVVLAVEHGVVKVDDDVVGETA